MKIHVAAILTLMTSVWATMESRAAADDGVLDKVILTPPVGAEPAIHGPRLFGVRPGRPFIYRIPCTGLRPMQFSISDLPSGLRVDAATGIITGTAPAKAGDYVVKFATSNAAGHAEKSFTIVVGDTLALTPPMGWNSWYIHYDRVTEQDIKTAADQMLDSGMADHGYQYVNVDDCWMKKKDDPPYRGADGTVLANAKFPDMADMARYIHSRGLRAGLYTSPGPWTCAKYVGAYQHEQADAKQFAAWGFDFLKYDWCSYRDVAQGKGLEQLKAPYESMGGILKSQSRDIVLNLCQYGMGDVWNWGASVGGQCWRTTGDLGLQRGSQLPGFYAIGMSNMEHWANAGPGAWNDPDYILIGWVGDAHRKGVGQLTTLSGHEQYSYMSMWSLMAAPLIFSGDMNRLDPFTLNVLCNAEAIDIDQDALGEQARPIVHTADTLILAKPMEDGSLAVGLFNLGEQARTITVTWDQLGIRDRRRARDVWRQKDVGAFGRQYAADVARHGVMLMRLFKAG